MCANEEDVLLWGPKKENSTHLTKFAELINKKYNRNIDNYRTLHRWSVDNYPQFWEEVFDYVQVKHSHRHSCVVNPEKGIQEVPEWFHGSRLNYAESLLSYRDDRVAIYSTGEGQEEIQKLTFKELYKNVASYAAALNKLGLEPGDRVAGYLPNCSEAVIAMLATASLGGVWTSTSPDFGVSGVLDRFKQIKPKVIFSVNAVVYNGKTHEHLSKLQEVIRELSDVEKVVIILYGNTSINPNSIANVPNSILLEDFIGSENEEQNLEFKQLPFNHPLFILYSSGTTGMPKCMVHSAGGTLLKHLEEHVIQSNMKRNDVLFYYTTTGWMMWNWLVSSLAIGSAIVLYEGSPLYPHEGVLWDLVDEIGITIFGTSAKYLSVLEDKGYRPREKHKLESLQMILSTGSTLQPRSYEYVYSDIKRDLLLGSISGGSDIVACFMGQNTDIPVHRGEVQSFHLGCAMECWSEGKPVFGQSGELVCTKPFPSMPIYFWNDPDGVLYRRAYFDKHPGVWTHGDYCIINPKTGGIVMLGRSDGTLNPSGVRFGSSEIYNIVESFPEIQDSLCVPQRNKDLEERVILFLKLRNGNNLADSIVKEIKSAIRKQLSSRHVPSLILETKDIPYTINGKKVEVAVRQVIEGQTVRNQGALANPASLELYKNLPELQGW